MFVFVLVASFVFLGRGLATVFLFLFILKEVGWSGELKKLYSLVS